MPLTPAQSAIITATVPILKTGGEALTTHFYKKLFRDYPDVQVFFNSKHQDTGAQPRALANAVLCYATHIEDLGQLGDLPAQIINKHVALQVQAEHYPIVGKVLLESIREVLGAETATDAVIDAWAAAYGQLADILIGAEAAVYKANAEVAGGWAGARPFTVAKKVKETDSITSFYLSPADGKEVMTYTAGQYLGLQLFVPATPGGCPMKTREIRRNYSLSQAADGKSLRITVKREDKGAASTYLHDTVAEGSSLNVYPPAGHFVMNKTSAKPAVLLSAGVGITPFMAMLQAIGADPNAIASPSVSFINVARTAEERPFTADVEKIISTIGDKKKVTATYINSSEGGSREHTLEKAIGALPDTADLEVYLLGPQSFMKDAYAQLIKVKAVPKEQIHFEFFGPTGSLE